MTNTSRYAKWTTHDQQKLLQLIAVHPSHQIAKIMRRSPASIRAMLHRLNARTQNAKSWFTVHSLATSLHIRRQEVQRWITLGWLKSRFVQTGKLMKPVIDRNDFVEFCIRHRQEVIGKRINQHRLDFLQSLLSPRLRGAEAETSSV